MPRRASVLLRVAVLLAATPRRGAGSPRARILRAARETPGLPLAALVETAGVGWGSLYWHLGKLTGEGLLQVESLGGRKRVFPLPLAPGEGERIELRLSPPALRVARVIVERPGISIDDLCLRTGLSSRATYHHLRGLVKAGLVDRGETRRYEALAPRPALRKALRGSAERPE